MNIKKVPAGDKVPEVINVFIEIPQGSAVKYELDKQLGIIIADRVMHTAMVYPFNYGFIPNTHAEDGDPIDVLVLMEYPLVPGVIIKCRPIGMLEMEDEAGIDTKIIAVPIAKIDPFYGKIKDISEVGETTKRRIQHFFDHYKEIEPGKWVKTKEFLSKKEAQKAIKKALIK